MLPLGRVKQTSQSRTQETDNHLIILLDVVTGVAVSGSAWYLTHLMRHPDVVWDRHNNPEPWNAVGPSVQSKLYSNTPSRFTKSWERFSDVADTKDRYA